MKAVGFESSITQEGKIGLPPEIAAEIPMGEQVRVLVMWEPSDSDLAWRSAGRRRLEAAYSPEDAMYEQLMDDSAPRWLSRSQPAT